MSLDDSNTKLLCYFYQATEQWSLIRVNLKAIVLEHNPESVRHDFMSDLNLQGQDQGHKCLSHGRIWARVRYAYSL